MKVEIGTAQLAARGQTVCGDTFGVLRGEDETTISVADGLGHGPLAAEASSLFCSFVEKHAMEDLGKIIMGAHIALKHTRGAAVALVRIDSSEQRMSFVGVGNIELKALDRCRINPFPKPGIVGQRSIKLLPFEYSLSDGDLMVLFSDGISNRFDLEEFSTSPAQDLAEAILAKHGKLIDDATCVVIKCRDDNTR
jgi:serine/threonine protein phosphatase PrpC